MVGTPKVASTLRVGVSSFGRSVVLVKVSQIPRKVTRLSGDTGYFSDDFKSRAQKRLHRRARAGRARPEAAADARAVSWGLMTRPEGREWECGETENTEEKASERRVRWYVTDISVKKKEKEKSNDTQ